MNADTTAVLKVTGQLIVGGCTPELSDGGVVDYGTIRLATLSATDVNQLGTKDVSLSISCPSATKAAGLLPMTVRTPTERIRYLHSQWQYD